MSNMDEVHNIDFKDPQAIRKYLRHLEDLCRNLARILSKDSEIYGNGNLALMAERMRNKAYLAYHHSDDDMNTLMTYGEQTVKEIHSAYTETFNDAKLILADLIKTNEVLP